MLANCQKALRKHFFGSADNSGLDIRHLKDERSFVIEPLLNAKVAETVPTPVDLSLKENGFAQFLNTKYAMDHQGDKASTARMANSTYPSKAGFF